MSRPAPLGARGQPLIAIGTVAAVAVALLLLDRAGDRTPEPANGGAARSGAWICPHGGGRSWSVSVFLANPGRSAVTARITALGEGPPEPASTIEIPAGATVRVPATATARGSATYVEYFGGWIGAGWVTASSSAGEGLAAEPCAGAASDRWFAPDGTTELDEDAYVVVANPFDAPAVIDVAVYTTDRAPVRDSDWTDLVVRPRRSIALHLNGKVEGEAVAATEVEASIGRVVAASVGITDGTLIRSALGSNATAPTAILPEIGASGQGELIVLSVSDATIRFGATALTEDPPRPAGGLTEQDHPPRSARAYPVQAPPGPTAIRSFVLDGATAVTALRALGPEGDLGSTAGTEAAARSWIVLPASAGVPAERGLVLANAGDTAVVATLQVLPAEGAEAPPPIEVDVPAHGAAAVPASFLRSAADAAIVARGDGPIAALSAASAVSDGRRGRGGGSALSMGVPIPQTT